MANVGSVTLPVLTLSGAGLGSAVYDGDCTLPAFTVSGSLEGPLQLPALSLSATLITGEVVSGDAFLPGLTVSATAITGRTAQGAITLPALTLDATTGVRANIQLTFFSLTATGVVGQVSKGPKRSPAGQTINQTSLVLPALSLAGSMKSELVSTGSIALAQPTLAATGITGLTGAGDMLLRAPTLSAAALTGNAPAGSLTLPLFTLSAAGAQGAASTGSLTLPALSMASLQQPQQPQNRTATGTLVMLGLSLDEGTMLPGTAATGSMSLRGLELDAVLSNAPPMTGDLRLAEFTLVASGLSSNAGSSATIRLDELRLSAQAVTGNAATAQITLPLMQLSATDGVLQTVGTASLTLPALQLSALAINGSVHLPDVEFTGIALNTRTKAVSEYVGLAPNSIASFAGVTLMATADGIVALAGSTDQGTPIDAHLLSPKSDLGDASMKRVLTGYVGLRADGELEMTLITDDHHENVYQLQPRRDAGEQHNTRVKFGRGVSGVYWQFKVANVDGADFALDRVELHPASTGAKV